MVIDKHESMDWFDRAKSLNLETDISGFMRFTENLESNFDRTVNIFLLSTKVFGFCAFKKSDGDYDSINI